ncbi:trafficking protein particle complex subunit 13 isoform X6 [Macrotis lagotis]|uniref:trafficking protein particle complex subunit 13 isoform X6 n=1 Tax=Macrotis lagotis TaxID=92651 RepID=UPI003D68AC6A
MSTEVVLYYRPCESNPTRLYKIAEEAINEFPTRPLLRFIPWFPNNIVKLALKPKRQPPIISGESAKEVDQHFTISEHHRKAQNYDCTMGLLEFQPNLEKRKCLARAQTLDEEISCGNSVMRLTKPTLFTNIPVTCEDRDLPGDLFNQLMKDDPSTVNGAETLMLGEMLTLPQNFGNIFLGETFSSYISVHNDSNQIVKDILVKADLQTSSQRLNLSASNATVAELKSDCCIDDVIHHEVKEIGTHILVCAVSYTTQSGEKMYFRKFFKFQVLKPLDVKTKFYNAESDLSSVTDEVFLEAQIQNITTSPMFMEKVSLEPSMMYNVVELNTVKQVGEGSERTMDLVLEMCNTNSIHWCGVSGRQLGKLNPSSSLYLALTLLSSVQGLQSVSGLRLTDTFLKRTYEYDDIAQVCVVSSTIQVES